MQDMFKKIILITALLLASCTNDTKTEDKTTGKVANDVAQEANKVFDKNDPLAYLNKAIEHIKVKEFREAEAAANTAYAMDSLNPAVLLAYGNVFYLRNKTRVSRDSWEACTSIDPDQIECRMKLAELYLTVGELQLCLTQLDEVLKRDKENYLANFIAGNAYLLRKDTTKAIRYVQRSIEYRSDYAKSHDLLGVLYAAKGNDLAIDYYKNAASLDPENGDIYYKLGLFYQQKSLFPKAVEAYVQAIQLNPRDEKSFYNLAYVNVAVKNYDKAIEHFSNAISLNSTNIEAYFGKAYAFEMIGDLNKSAENYRACLMIKPTYLPAMDGLDRLKEAQKR